MAGLILLAVLSLGLAQGLTDPAEPTGALPVDLPTTDIDAGPAHVSTGADGVAVDTDLPLPVAVDTSLSCPTCPRLSIQVGPGATQPASTSTDTHESKGPLAAIQDAPPAAIVAGSSLLATVLGFLAWLARPAFGMFSRIEDGELADHPLRRQALDYIAANPGASLQDVRRSLGVAWGTAVYHLGRLERAGQVAVRHVGGRRGHWPLGQAPARDALAPTGQALATLVGQRPGLSQNELARLAGIQPPAACKQLRRLESAGLVSATRQGKSRVYAPTERLALAVAVAA